MSNYLIGEGYIGGSSLKIDEVRFNGLVLSKKVIRLIWDIEETFSLLANSFVEFEEYLVSVVIKLHYKQIGGQDLHRFFDNVRQNINLKLVAMLTVSRIYEEQTHQRLSALSGLVHETIDMKPVFSKAFDESIEYRVVYSLRNHALHNQLPVHKVTYNSTPLSETRDTRSNAPIRFRETVNPKISVREFIESKKINATTKQEVEKLGYEYLDLKFFIRGFVAALAGCHEAARVATQPYLDAALDELRKAHHELWEAKGAEPKFMVAVKLHDGRKEEDCDIDYPHNSRLLEVRQLWTGLKLVQRGFVSSEITKDKSTYPEEHPTIWIAK